MILFFLSFALTAIFFFLFGFFVQSVRCAIDHPQRTIDKNIDQNSTESMLENMFEAETYDPNIDQVVIKKNPKSLRYLN